MYVPSDESYKSLKGGKELFLRMANKKNLKEFYHKAKTGQGYILPGSKYIGPGNPLNLGKPMSRGDRLAMYHDRSYHTYLKAGVSPYDLYTGFADSDQRLMNKSDKATAEGFTTYYGMGAKKAANRTGLTKRIRDNEVFGSRKSLR